MSGETLMEKTYSSSEIQRIAKITKMQAIHWTQTEIITPFEDARGRGSRRVYSWENLIEMMVCRELNRYNIERFLMKTGINVFNKPFRNCSSYWEYLKENPKTDIFYLVISLAVNKLFQGDIKGYLQDFVLKSTFLDLIEKYRNLVKETWESREKTEDSLPITMIMEKESLDILIQIHKSCVVVNIDALVEEAKQG